MPKKMNKKGSPETHRDLKGFDIKVNEFGQIEGSMNVDQINDFLNKQVEDKKLKNRKKK
jgi:hypothetical protein